MPEYYRLGVLRRVRDVVIGKLTGGADWEYFYLEIDKDDSKIKFHEPGSVEARFRVLNSKLQKISKEEMDIVIREANTDRTYG